MEFNSMLPTTNNYHPTKCEDNKISSMQTSNSASHEALMNNASNFIRVYGSVLSFRDCEHTYSDNWNENGMIQDKMKRGMTSWWCCVMRRISSALSIALAVIFAISIVGLIHFIDVHLNSVDNTSNDANNEAIVYEYIVAGAGPSGIITAVKLAQFLHQRHSDTKKLSSSLPRVLLIEAGTSSQSNVISNLYEHNAKQTNHQRQYRDEPKLKRGGFVLEQQEQQHVLSLNQYDIPLLWTGASSASNNANHWMVSTERETLAATDQSSDEGTIIGKSVGGGGVNNAMLYVRGLPQDFKDWNSDLWTWDKHIVRQYIGLETYVNGFGECDDRDRNSSYGSLGSNTSSKISRYGARGCHGPLRTSTFVPFNTTEHERKNNFRPGLFLKTDEVAPLFIESSIGAGIPMAPSHGFNGLNPTDRIGVGYYEFNIWNGVRDSVAEAYLGRRRQNNKGTQIPDNLDILTGATVLEVLNSVEHKHDVITVGDKMNRQQENDPVAAAAIGVKYLQAIRNYTTNEISHEIRTVFLRKQTQRREHDQKDSIKDERQQPHPEVILAAGAILTPQLLFNSGIHENGTISEVLGVGKNLMDHPAIPVAFELKPNIAQQSPSIYTLSQQLDKYKDAVSKLRLIQQRKEDAGNDEGVDYQGRRKEKVEAIRTGTFGTAGISAGAFLKSPYADKIQNDGKITSRTTDEETRPDIQLTVFPRVIEPHVVRKEHDNNDCAQNNDNIPSSECRDMSKNYDEMLITVTLLRPEGRHELKFAQKPKRKEKIPEDDAFFRSTSSNTGKRNKDEERQSFQMPTIGLVGGDNMDKSYLTPLDLKRLAWGVQQVRGIMKQPPLSDSTGVETYPGTQYLNGFKLKTFIQENYLHNAHWSGTSRMGNLEKDHMAVVDEHLRVRGVENLRIVDASTFPVIPNGNTHSTVCAVASRAVELILGQNS